ncbi:MAG: VanZ family protein [Halobacteriales archaeon]|nr:VanZ family protein [Halobacteriales archaeon]
MYRLPFPALPRRVRYGCVLAVAAFIAFYSLTGTPPRAPSGGPLWDKYLHFVAYAGLGAMVAYATLERPLAERVIIVLATAGLYGVAIELAQGVLPTRYFSVGDMTANVLGAALSLTWLLVERRIRYVSG